MKKFAHHLPHYLSLFGILSFAAAGLVLFSWDKALQMAVGVATTAAYVAWGVVHHAYHEDLYLPVLLEYIIVAVLGLVIVFSVLFRV